ncbi:MAG: hypothetical protein ACLGQW_00050 [Acidobacteriota bacterium]
MPKPVFVCLFALVAVLCGLPSRGDCDPGEIRQLVSELERASVSIIQKGTANPFWEIQAAFAKNPPGPGWTDWSESNAPSVKCADSVASLLRTADALGFLDRRDMLARRILWEISGRIRPTKAADQRWFDKTKRWLKTSVRFENVAAGFDTYTGRVRGCRVLLLQLKGALRREVRLAGGVLPTSRPLLAEAYPAYRKMMRDSQALLVRAKALEARLGPATPRDWPGRVRAVQDWALFVQDKFAVIAAAKVREDSPVAELEFVEFSLFNDGWSFDAAVRETCWQVGLEPSPFPIAEQATGKSVYELLEAFFFAYNASDRDLHDRVAGWLHKDE